MDGDEGSMEGRTRADRTFGVTCKGGGDGRWVWVCFSVSFYVCVCVGVCFCGQTSTAVSGVSDNRGLFSTAGRVRQM